MRKDVLVDMTIEDLRLIENQVERAMYFAIIAHRGQVRKGNPEVDYVMHPIKVANLLRKYGADRNLIAAGYLHDVIEDTKYTYKDLNEYFCFDVVNLVRSATEEDKSLSWEERKTETIEKVKTLGHREKMLCAADKLANIEDLEEKFGELGYNDFSAFKRGEEHQEWYFRNIYMSIIENEDKNDPLYQRLERGINNTFSRTMEKYFEEGKIIIKK